MNEQNCNLSVDTDGMEENAISGRPDDDVQPDIPERMYMDDPHIEWRTVKPNYDKVDANYLVERTQRHAVHSLEKAVENLVKTWEMESTHKINPKVPTTLI